MRKFIIAVASLLALRNVVAFAVRKCNDEVRDAGGCLSASVLASASVGWELRDRRMWGVLPRRLANDPWCVA